MVLRCLLAHYRRHPLQAVFLLTSIVLANALLVGTLLINAQARSSYAAGAQVLNASPAGEIRARETGAFIDDKDYIVLRRQGFHRLVPMLRWGVRLANGEPLEILGVDPLAMPRDGAEVEETGEGAGFSEFSQPPYQLWVSPTRMNQLGYGGGDLLETLEGRLLPPLTPVGGGVLGHRLLMDIGALQAFSGQEGYLSHIMVLPMPARSLKAMEAALPEHLVFVASDQAPDPAELTRSFHLNLAAMGLLAFVVGVFLTYNALAFSYTDRHETLRRLRLSGVTRSGLRRSLLLELGGFLAIGSLVGWLLGAQLAGALLPGVGRTLAQLYGVYVQYPDQWSPGGAWLPLMMTAVAALLCVAWPLRRSLQAPLLERWTKRWQQQEVLRRDRIFLLTGVALLVLAGGLSRIADSTLVALAGMASLLLGAALCLPLALRGLLHLLGSWVPAGKPRMTWMIADSRWLLGPASLALMAMTLALVANSGLNTMIHSFRQATDDWLQQRLSAQLYFRSEISEQALDQWLSSEAPGAEWVARYRSYGDYRAPAGNTVRVEVVTLQDDDRFADTIGLMREADGADERFWSGAGVFISERAWRLDGWQPGERVELCPGVVVPVLGVYRDYGNPLSQWISSETLFRSCWPARQPVSRAIIGPDSLEWESVRERLAARFGLEQDELISQAELRAVGMQVFDRTFRVTNALNTLTLLVAGIGIFCAISAIHHHRVAQQALLTALGLSRRERGLMLLFQWGLLGFLCMVVVWPFGALLAAYLSNVVTPVAFGWSFALRAEWSHYWTLALLAASCLMLAVMLPSFRLLRSPPAAMLREEAL
jgi:putative ABC transport system permease protein